MLRADEEFRVVGTWGVMLGVSLSLDSLAGAAVRVEVCPSVEAGTETWLPVSPRAGVAVVPVAEDIPLHGKLVRTRTVGMPLGRLGAQLSQKSAAPPGLLFPHSTQSSYPKAVFPSPGKTSLQGLTF